MSADIKRCMQTGNKCQKSKVEQQTRSPPDHFSAPDGQCKHIHVDLVGPLAEVDRNEYLLTIVDCLIVGQWWYPCNQQLRVSSHK